jgi:two-component system sensor histidine kinase KdpD
VHRLNRAPDPGQLPRLLAVGISSLTVATGAVALFETYLGVPNASIIYLAAVVATAIAAGTLGAILTAVASVVLYDYFFTVPYQTLTVSDPGEWLSVILLLFVGIVVGQLAAMQRAEAEEARRNEREANAISTVSRALATRNATPTVLGPIARVLGAETRMTRI